MTEEKTSMQLQYSPILQGVYKQKKIYEDAESQQVLPEEPWSKHGCTATQLLNAEGEMELTVNTSRFMDTLVLLLQRKKSSRNNKYILMK